MSLSHKTLSAADTYTDWVAVGAVAMVAASSDPTLSAVEAVAVEAVAVTLVQ